MKQGHVAVNTLTKVHNVSQAEEKEACLALGAKASNDGMHICVQATDSQRREVRDGILLSTEWLMGVSASIHVGLCCIRMYSSSWI